MATDKIVYEMDFSDLVEDLDRGDRADALDEVGQYALEAMLADVGEARSPVTGRQFKGLSPAYKKFKEKFSSNAIANLELSGDMLDALTYRVRGNRVQWGIWDGEQAAKADGHNNFSGESKLPPRKFIPDAARGETFRPEIRDGINEIIQNALESGDVRVER